MSFAGSKILPFPPLFRRSEQTGITQRSFPARWLALLLMGSVGAAYALNPTMEEKAGLAAQLPASQMIAEGESQVVSQLLGSLIGDVDLSSEDRTLLTSGGLSRGRVVLQSKVSPATGAQSQREKAEFLRTVEELEASFVDSGQYPALPAGGAGGGASVSYRAASGDFTLSSGNRRYTPVDGMTYGTPPAPGTGFEVKGFLAAESHGWGPWKSDRISLQAKSGAEVEGLEFLQDLPPAPAGSARLFFPVDRATCGYLFRGLDGKSVYSSGELTYDGVSGAFSLKLFRSAETPSSSLSPKALEAELKNHDTATALVGDAALLADLGLTSRPVEGEQVVALSSAAPQQCSVSTALDGLRLASLQRHKEVLAPGPFLAAAEGADDTQAGLVGSVQLLDKLGQWHQLRLRGGRGANYDWVVGQICPQAKEARVAGFVDSQAASYLEQDASSQHPVKAGQ